MMQIYSDSLSDVVRYLENHKKIRIEDKKPEFDRWLSRAARFVTIGAQTKILEVGTGIGWFPILCKIRGLDCRGIEISPQLLAYAIDLGKACGVDPEIELGNVEEFELEKEAFDIVIAWSTFEHVEFWRKGLANITAALKPGGVFFFSSTNKFSLTSGEYRFPLYGWLPKRARFRLRVARQGSDIMKLGIDFNQFTYPRLRHEFRKLGYRKILDRLDLLDPQTLRFPSRWKQVYLRLTKRLPAFKHLALTFIGGTEFVCLK